MAELAKKRGRPAGSTNKPKVTGGLEILKFEKQIEGAPITRNSSQGWVNWGIKNDYPNLLLNLYNESPTHRAAIEFGVQSICAGGVDYDAMGVDGSQIYPNYQYSWDELIRALALDYMLYGSYAIQIILNKDRNTYSFWHIGMDKVRCGEYDEDGQIMEYYISSDWTSIGLNPPIVIDAFDTRDDFKVEYGKPYLYVYRHYDPTMTYYQSPHYASGIKSIQSEIEMIQFDLKHIVNGFCAAGVLTVPQVETDEQRKAIINNIQNMFQGSENANTIAITFKTSVEDSPVQWTPFTDKSSSVNQYAESNLRTQARILAAHQIPDASLCGLPSIGNNGFASEADKLETAFQLYQRLTGNFNRQCVIRTLNFMFKLNGIDTEIVMKPLHFNDFGDDENDTTKNNDVTARESSQDISTKNIEEKVENN